MVLVARGHLAAVAATDQHQANVGAASEPRHGKPALTCQKHNKESPNRCCCCCSCCLSEPRQRTCNGNSRQTKVSNCTSKSAKNQLDIHNHSLNQRQQINHISNDKMSKSNKKSLKILVTTRNNKSNNQQQQVRNRSTQMQCNRFNCCDSRPSDAEQLVVGCDLGDNLANCAKCQLIARWTSAQARLTKSAKRASDQASQISKSSGQLNVAGNKLLRPMRTINEHRQPVESRERRAGSGCDLREVALRDCCEPQQQPPKRSGARHLYLSRAELVDRQLNELGEEEEKEDEERRSHEGLDSPVEGCEEHCDNDDDEAEISSLTTSSIEGSGTGTGAMTFNEDVWSLSSCYEKEVDHQEKEILRRPQLAQAEGDKMLPNLRANRRRPLMVAPFGGVINRKLRPAPLPPVKGAGPAGSSGRITRVKRQQPGSDMERSGCDHSLDSGNSSGGDTNAGPPQITQRQLMTKNKTIIQTTCQKAKGFEIDKTNANQVGGGALDSKQQQPVAVKPDLLSEIEVHSIEHFLRSHKSSIYVCGCMANLYLTSTQLVDNGRCSMPSSDGWQLSKTGVPVLTFDSGLTRNRNKRRLSINLAERGSGFVLWSDIIDHLSNYRAYQTRTSSYKTSLSTSSPNSSNRSLCSPSSRQKSNSDDHGEPTCDTFHVMYLSTNHRIMVGLSFDDAKCARLFLRQVELVTSDPANISLTGPKLARRLASVGGIGRLLSPSKNQKDRNQMRGRKRSKSIGPLSEEHLDNENKSVQLGAESDPGRPRNPSKLESLVQRRQPASKQAPQKVISNYTNQHRFTTGVDYTWSTLKRAIRFGQQQHVGRTTSVANSATSKKQIGLSGKLALAQDETGEFLEREGLAPSIQPKPLATLAMSGKIYKAGKKLPRKCDISAPCLFQHVTSVDLNGLERLYSRSLVQGSSASSRSDCNEKSSVDCQQPAANGLIKSNVTASCHNEICEPNNQVRVGEKERKNSQISSSLTPSGARCQQQLVNQHGSSTMAATNTNTTTSSSSCYSSASISPASSECGAHLSMEQRRQYRCSRNLGPRPVPPKVPQRTSSTAEPGGGQLATQRHQQQGANSGAGLGGANNKIQAIIRELQAQTSAELVDAKRKLMADIADQVLARAFSSTSSTSTSTSSASSSSSSSSADGAVSRL